jgi:hypothetical protein
MEKSAFEYSELLMKASTSRSREDDENSVRIMYLITKYRRQYPS